MDNIITIVFDGSAPVMLKLNEAKTKELLFVINKARVVRQTSFLSLAEFIQGMSVYIEPEKINYIVVQTEENAKQQNKRPAILMPQIGVG